MPAQGTPEWAAIIAAEDQGQRAQDESIEQHLGGYEQVGLLDVRGGGERGDEEGFDDGSEDGDEDEAEQVEIAPEWVCVSWGGRGGRGFEKVRRAGFEWGRRRFGRAGFDGRPGLGVGRCGPGFEWRQGLG